ncbi:uncharacterized protein BDV14DRAFT_196472 [Aspergillus stella-maris]|uniref:uncharacterized protein n=1 Tax=Aspergillus stella-maris TaxID=1810926 RepID=UPI003CCCE779
MSWEENDVITAGGWQQYLNLTTGVHGTDWLSNKAYMIFDDAHKSYWDYKLESRRGSTTCPLCSLLKYTAGIVSFLL